jgi:hypothetical protein
LSELPAADPSLLDMKQATPGLLIQRLGQLTDAITMTNRYVVRMQSDMDGRLGRLETSNGELKRAITDAHSDVLLNANQIINLQHDMLRLLQERKTERRAQRVMW